MMSKRRRDEMIEGLVDTVTSVASETKHVVASAGWFSALSATKQAIWILFGAIVFGFVLGMSLSTRWSTVRQLPEQVVMMNNRIDSSNVVSMERSERIREEIRAVSDRAEATQRLLDDLVCVLTAQARGLDPQMECRDPLPLVPFLF